MLFRSHRVFQIHLLLATTTIASVVPTAMSAGAAVPSAVATQGDNPSGSAGAAPSRGMLGPDNPAALLPAIMEAYRAGRSQFVIPPGVYKLPEPRGGFYLSFGNMKNFRIIGKRVTLLRTDPTKGGVRFTDCRRVAIEGVTLRCNPFPYTQARVTAINAKARWLDVRVCRGYPSDLGNTRRFRMNLPPGPWIYRQVCGNFFNPHSYQRIAGTMDTLFVKSVRIGPRGFRLHLSTHSSPLVGQPVRVGDLLALQGRIHSDILFNQCSHMLVQNVTVMAGTGFCFHENGGNDNHYIGDAIIYPPKPYGAKVPPLMASNADGFHSDGARHGPTVRDCHFEGMGDDGIAIHGFYAMLRRVTGTHWVVVFPWHYSSSFIQLGDRLKLYDRHGVYIGSARVVSLRKLPRYHPKRPILTSGYAGAFSGPPQTFYELVLNHPVVNARFRDRISDVNANGRGFTIRGCIIKDNRSRGMIIKADDGIVEDNTVEGCATGGIIVSPELFGSDEAGSSCNLLIEHNTIKHVGYAIVWLPGTYQAGALSITANVNGPKRYSMDLFGHHDIAVIGNRFIDNDGINLLVTDTTDALISGNTFTGAMRRLDNRGAEVFGNAASSSLIWLQQCNNVLLAGNRVMHPGSALKKLVGVGLNVGGVKGIRNGVIIQGPRNQ